MRRTLPVVFALLLAVMPGVALAQSPAPAGPPAFEIAPGVVGEGLAFLPGATDPVVYRLRFEPGSAYDAVGDASVALVTIESGSLTITAPVELTVYPAIGDGTPRTEPAGSAVTMAPGDSFLFPADVDAHLTNDGPKPASMIVAALYPTGSDAAESPDASMVPDSAIPTDPALLGTGLVPEGWQIVEDATSTCRIAVPSDWTTGVAPGVGQTSVLAEGLAAVSADTQPWESLTQTIDQFYLAGHLVLLDTPDAFLIASPDDPDVGLSYLLALRYDDANCLALVTVQANGLGQHGPAALLVSQTLAHAE